MLQHPTYWATLRSELLTSQGCTRCGGPGVFTYTRRLDSIDSRLPKLWPLCSARRSTAHEVAQAAQTRAQLQSADVKQAVWWRSVREQLGSSRTRLPCEGGESDK